MSKLLQRLQDPSRSGVYRTSADGAITEAVHRSNVHLARIRVAKAASKKDLLDSIAAALRFPSAFARNWDALEDALRDLSWLDKPSSHVVLFENVSIPDRQVLLEVMETCAGYWKGQRVGFFAVFIDPLHVLKLPDLYKE